MASPAQPLTSSTTIQSSGGKPPITVSGSSAVIDAIAQNTAFPAQPVDVSIGQLNAQASTAGSFNLPGVGSAPVSFSASGSAYAGIAAYQTVSKLESDLGFQGSDSQPLNVEFPSDANSRYMVVRWGFDASAQASGKIALNPAVNLSFGASGSGEGLFAFVSAVNKSMLARDAVVNLLNSWCTPGEVANNSNALPAGCWIVTEVTGQLNANLGLNVGYDFSWVKSVQLNQLDGDIGLRILLGLKAMLTVQLGGKYYMVLNRESSLSGVRLRLFRTTTKGWGFALNSGATVALSTGSLLPSNLDDFVKAILGIHDAQLLKFLDASNLSDISNALGGAFLQKLRLDGDVSKGFNDLQNLFKAWNNLPSTVTSVVWKAAAKSSDLNTIQAAAKQISQLSESSIQSVLDSWLHDVSFQDNPVCQWLEAAASKSLFDLYESSQLQQLRLDASKLSDLLDGTTVQDTLTKLKTQVDNALDLPTLESALSANNLTGVAVWVTQQLAKFAGVDLSQLTSNIGKINAAIKTIRGKAQQIYAETEKALNNTYAFSLDYAYTSSSTQSALIDVEFTDAARAQLAAAIRGDFTQILNSQISGVKLNTATLTHSIERHSHVETHLPWWTGASDDLAKGYATGTFVDGNNGRVQFFEAGATDVDTMYTNTNLKRFASCSVGISGTAAGIRQYNIASVDFGYSFVTSRAAMSRSEFEFDFADAADQYFPNVFGDDSTDPSHAVFKSWVVDWDKYTDQTPGMPSGDGIIGNTWANLQIRSRNQAGLDWVSALLDATQVPDYMAMSRQMQTEIRRWLLRAFASDPSRFKNIPGRNWIGAFLVYTAMPAFNEYRLDGQNLVSNPKGAIVWDVRDVGLATAMTETFAATPLQANLNNIYNLLNGIPALKGSAPYYQNASAKLLGDILQGLTATDSYISLLQAEKTVIDGAQAAFQGLRNSGAKQLQNALPTFSAALVNLVTKFNANLISLSLASPQVMRLFSPMVFQAAIAAMLPSVAAPANDALLDVAVLNPTAPLPGTDQSPSQGQVLMRHRITSFA
jgi:hypothetical protein